MLEDEDIEYEEGDVFEGNGEELDYDEDDLNMQHDEEELEEDNSIEESDLAVLFPKRQQKLVVPVVHIEYERDDDLEDNQKRRETVALPLPRASKNKS